MSLLEDFQNALAEDEYLNVYSAEDEIEDITQVANEYEGGGRWTEHWEAVFRRGDEYVGLSYELPATEMQEGSEGESEVYAVEPHHVTVTKYRRV